VRGLLIFLAVFSALPFALVYPFVGVLLWEWISFMSPHREAFGLAATFPFNFYIAVVTVGAWIFSSEAKSLPSQILPGLLIAFALFVSLTTFFALEHTSAYELWDTHIKSLALALVVMGLVNSRARMQAFLWVIAISLGYFAVKGAGFTLLTGSIGSRILGPEHSIIRDNNNLGLAMVMTLPILNYLRTSSTNYYVRLAGWIALAATIVAIVGTYSRGGFVGLLVVGIGFLVLGKHRVAYLIIAALVGTGIVTFAPAEWKERMVSIQSYEKDSSAKGRLEAWETAWNLATDRPLLGGGFAAIEQKDTFYKYRPGRQATHKRAPHSIYFQVLGDHGFVGLFLYVALIIGALSNLFQIQAQTRKRPDLEWANTLSRMLLISYAGFLVAGSFLSMAYYDVFLCLIALSVALREIVNRTVQAAQVEPDEVELVPVGGVTASSGK
jgi:probable O-glycosylation ligase (exosortase A-associated)